MSLFRIDCRKDLFSFPFEKRARIPCLVWSHVLCACQFIFCSGSLDIIGGMHYWIFVTMRLIDVMLVRFEAFVRTLILETNVMQCQKYVFHNREDCVYKILRSVLQAILGRVTMYVFWLVVGARHFPSHCATVCDCHWEYPPEGCRQSNQKKWKALHIARLLSWPGDKRGPLILGAI